LKNYHDFYFSLNPNYKYKYFIIYRFPLNKPELLKKWLHQTKRKNFTPTKYSRLCSEHFVDDDYLIRPGSDVKLLKDNAFPTIFKGFPNLLQQKLPVKRRILQKYTVNIKYPYNN